jgi:phospholipid transport system substrate-binding protein
MPKILIILGIFIISTPSFGHCNQPLDALQGPLDHALAILSGPHYQNPDDRNSKYYKLLQIFHKLFDFNEIARRTLSTYWQDFTPEQRSEFRYLLTRFLGNIYLHKLMMGYSNERIVYTGQRILNESKALVHIKVIRGSFELPVVCNMRKRDGIWRIYDIKTEGISLIRSYRSQFRRILDRESPEELIRRLRRKIKES